MDLKHLHWMEMGIELKGRREEGWNALHMLELTKFGEGYQEIYREEYCERMETREASSFFSR